ncbi:MAG: amidohydrolase family protein, partial [bacterium]|nr:amidohydrolase family protein [bacterium]
GDAIELVRRCPEVRFMLDHIGKPGIKDGISEPWRTQMRELATLPNVECKISGVVTEADHKAWTYDQVAPYVAHAIDCFGFDRVAFGGDWPVAELASNLVEWVGIVDRVTQGASPEELRKLYRDNAIRFYRM